MNEYLSTWVNFIHTSGMSQFTSSSDKEFVCATWYLPKGATLPACGILCGQHGGPVDVQCAEPFKLAVRAASKQWS